MSNALNKGKTTQNSKNLDAGVFTGIISKVTGIYVLLMLAVFPLFTTDLYYNVLADRFYFFFYTTLALTVISLMVFLVGLLGGAFRRTKDGKSPLSDKLRLSSTDICFLVFFAVCLVSTLTSNWVYEAFWGNMGRMQGLFFFIIVLFSWFFVTRFFVFKPSYLYIFLAVGVLVMLWGVTDYLGMDIFGWRADADNFWEMLAFTSSIGNVNTYTAIVSLYFGLSAVLCVDRRHIWFLLPVFFISSLGLITGASDNAFLAVAGTFAVLPFYIFGDRRRIGPYVVLLALFVFALVFTGWITSVWTKTPVLYVTNWGILLKIANNHWQQLIMPAAVLLAAGILLWVLLRKEKNIPSKALQILWGAVCVLGILAVAYCVYDANTSAKLTFLENYRDMLVFNDRWGTNRGYAWRSSFDFFKDFSLWKKLVGSGPETYAVFMTENFYYEMIDFMGVVFDSPHSEPIQYLFTVGILGFISFYAMIITGFLKGFRTGGYAAGCAFAVAAYIFASIINISVPISTPLLFLCLEMAIIIPKANEEKN